LVLVLGACATTPKINAGLVAKTRRVENAGPPVLVIAKSLAEDGTAFAYASGLDPDFTIENVAFAAGHSENTKLLQARLSAGPKHWSLLSLAPWRPLNTIRLRDIGGKVSFRSGRVRQVWPLTTLVV